MELQITNRDAPMIHEAFGISEERSNELCDHMDSLAKTPHLKPRKLCETLQDIAAHCNTPEELVFCTITHIDYLTLKHHRTVTWTSKT